MTWRVHHGDCVEVLATFEPESIDAAVTDPPYGIGFMGREWDMFKPGLAYRPKAKSKPARRRKRRATKIAARGTKPVRG